MVDSSALIHEKRWLEARERLEGSGYLLVRKLLPHAPVMECRAHILGCLDEDGVVDTVAGGAGAVTGGAGAGADAGAGAGAAAVGLAAGLVKPGVKGQTMSGRRTYTHHPASLRIMEAPEIQAVMGELLQEPAGTFDTKWLRVIGTGESTSAHSDAFFFGPAKPILVSWIPLGAVEASSGPLAVCEESHRLDHSEFRSDEIPAGYAEAADRLVWKSATFGPGDVLIFKNTMLHASLVNETGRWRLSADVRWQPKENFVGERSTTLVAEGERKGS